jgi:hypothetical protein
MREKMGVLTVAALVARKANETMVVHMVGSGEVYVSWECGVRWSAFVGRNLASVAIKML